MFFRWHYLFFGLAFLVFLAWGALAIITYGFSENNSWQVAFAPPAVGTLFMLLGAFTSQIYKMNPYDSLGQKIKKIGSESKLIFAGLVLIAIGSLAGGMTGNNELFRNVAGLGVLMIVISLFSHSKHTQIQSQLFVQPTDQLANTEQIKQDVAVSPALKTLRVLVILSIVVVLLLAIVGLYLFLNGDWGNYQF